MSHQHEPGKTLVESRYKIDIFEDCLHSYADKSGRLRQFPLNRIVLLYAITVFLRNRASISDEDFALRLRSINNLIQNSEDEVSDRIDRNRLPAILQQTDAIMLTGSIDDRIDNSFNVNQMAEEKEKKLFLEANPEKAADLFALEDHPNLKGQIGIIGLDHVDYADRFASLFRYPEEYVRDMLKGKSVSLEKKREPAPAQGVGLEKKKPTAQDYDDQAYSLSLPKTSPDESDSSVLNLDEYLKE